MSYARAKAKKHYRAVKKQLEQSPKNNYLIPKSKKNLILGLSIAVLCITFLKGLLFGYIIGNHDN